MIDPDLTRIPARLQEAAQIVTQQRRNLLFGNRQSMLAGIEDTGLPARQQHEIVSALAQLEHAAQRLHILAYDVQDFLAAEAANTTPKEN